MIKRKQRICCCAFLSAALLCGTIHNAAAQQSSGAVPVKVPEQMSQEEMSAFMKKLPTDGWVLLSYQGALQLLNYSNKEYILNLRLNCADGHPGYLVEYSDAYGDGDWGGLDFVSSGKDDGKDVHFLLDGKDYKDPFAGAGTPGLKAFSEALKKAQKLTISAYDMEMNPETGKNESKLNRSIDFKLAHPELLESAVSCNE